MRIPFTVSTNTLKTYKLNDDFVLNNQIVSCNFDNINGGQPKSLQEICVECLATNWEDKPILDEIQSPIDRNHLLDLLSTNLPISLTIPRVNDDIYWKKCFKNRWPTLSTPKHCNEEVDVNFSIVRTNFSTNSSRRSSLKTQTSRSWKECYIETHVKVYLENLRCEDYDAEKIKELCDLCGPFVRKLCLNQLQFSSIAPNRVPLNGILAGLENINELSLCFKQTYVGENFSWNILQTTFQDIQLLAKGLEKLRLQILRITNTDIDDDKLIIILKALYKHTTIKTLDFSHCKIGNNGVLALCNFFLHQPLANLFLQNNKIGAKGIRALGLAICQQECKINEIDLRLNDIYDQGGILLMKYVAFACTLKNLKLAGCGFTHQLEFCDMLTLNNTLQELDLSNNHLKDDIGKFILNALKFNTSLRKLDLRMCKISSETEFLIQQKLQTNRKANFEKLQPTFKTLPAELNNDELKTLIKTYLN